jgi:predicted enzyme related to lactoylglutathione lyase
VDCVDPPRVSEFWGRLLGVPVRTTGLPGWLRIGPTASGGPAITFQPVPEEKTGKARIHLDVWVDQLDAAIVLVGELGGGASSGEIHRYDEGTVVVMSDIEGNEFCLVGPPRPQ